MIAFLTLFLGLVTGAHLVEIAVSDPAVTTVQLDLDGRTVAVLHQPPWSTVVDLGDHLTPHELVAKGLDAQGATVAEVRQWINLPRDRAELEILLERDPDGDARRGQLLWSSVDAAAPETVRVSFDGEALDSADWRAFEIPEHDPSTPHLLQAELTAGGNTSRAQVVVGGGGSAAVNGELTAVLVALDGKAKIPSPSEMGGWLGHRGTDLRAVAVEHPGADVVMVQDLDWTVQGLLNRLRQEMLAPRVAGQNRPSGLKSRDEFRILFPIPEVSDDASTPSLQFPKTPNLWSGQEQETFSRGAARRQIATPIPQGVLEGIPVNAERRIDTSRQSLADATAAAGLAVAAGRRGRAIVLVAGSETADRSRATPQQVRSYLADLQVPLVVWSPQPELVDPGWGEVHPITNRPQLTRSIRELRELLDRQVVVWVEGSYLPNEIRLTPRSDGRLTALVGTREEARVQARPRAPH